jgi:hypothetical protein
MHRFLSQLALVLLIASPATAADPATGNWKVISVNNYQIDLVDCIIKLDKDDGKWTAELVVASPFAANAKVKSVAVENGKIRLVMEKGNAEVVFDGILGNEKKILGSYGNDRRVTAGKLIWTEDEKLDQRSALIRKEAPAPMQEMDKMQSAINQLRGKLRQATEDDEKKTLGDEIKAQQKAAEAALPGLLKQVLAKHADDPAAFDAAVLLIRGAAKYGVSADDARKWAITALNRAAEYGPRFRQETQLNLAEAMVANPALLAIAAEFAKRAESDLGSSAPIPKQVRVLNVVVHAMGDTPEAKPFAARLEKLETSLDKEYIAKHAKLEVEPYQGRKSGGGKSVLLELFTGAQCPPCVAADIAFDKLCENYKQDDVILLQYHMHIPGPDPLTNNDTEARWKYYTEAFPKSVGGVPTSIFNGKPDSGGGGGEAQALSKLKAYRKIIDPVLDEEGKTKIAVKATRAGDVVTIGASVSDLPEPGESMKLRFALVEESIRYEGSNGIRFHHHVVRAMPGGADGVSLGGANETRQVSVNLAELRGNLSKYLDEFVKDRGPFPKPNRPLELKKLKAVAWVQDDKDEDRTVLHAVMVDVTGGSGAE